MTEIRVAFYLNLSNFKNFHLEQFQQGNYALSGTISSFIRVVLGLCELQFFRVSLYTNTIFHSNKLKSYNVASIKEAIELANTYSVEMFVFHVDGINTVETVLSFDSFN